jgi:hypothetical protein
MGLTQSIATTVEPVQTEEKQAIPQETQIIREAEVTPEEPKKDIFERYVEPQGTKIEVQPADVTAADDVVKKTKKKKVKSAESKD